MHRPDLTTQAHEAADSAAWKMFVWTMIPQMVWLVLTGDLFIPLVLPALVATAGAYGLTYLRRRYP